MKLCDWCGQSYGLPDIPAYHNVRECRAIVKANLDNALLQVRAFEAVVNVAKDFDYGDIHPIARPIWDRLRAALSNTTKIVAGDSVGSMPKLVEAARAMVKHQKDRHELGSCCTDVTPTPAYLLEKALEADVLMACERHAMKRYCICGLEITGALHICRPPTAPPQ